MKNENHKIFETLFLTQVKNNSQGYFHKSNLAKISFL